MSGSVPAIWPFATKEIGTFVPDGSGAVAMPTGSTGKLKEAAAALAVLGYGAQEVNTALKNVDVEHLSLEDIIRQALKQMIR